MKTKAIITALAVLICSALSAESGPAKPVDLSLWGWLTSKETRAYCRAYYKYQALPKAEQERVRKMAALVGATAESGAVDDAEYRRIRNRRLNP